MLNSNASVSPLIITCAITGDRSVRDKNPGIPLTCAEQAQESFDAYNAGACMVHVHRRSAADHAVTSTDPNEYLEVNAAIRAKSPEIIVNNTSGGSKKRDDNGMISSPQTVSITAKPEVASIDAINLIGPETSAQIQPPFEGRDKEAKLTYEESKQVQELMKKHDCKPEYMCYGFDDYKYIVKFINAGLLDAQGPHWVQLLFSGTTVFERVEELLEAMRTLPENCILGIIAGGDTQWEVMAVAIALGVHVRIGMEDNMYLSKDVLATSNAKLVEKIANIARELNRPIATAAEAREMLGISSPRHYSW